MKPAGKRNAGVAPGGFGEATTDNAESTRSRTNSQARCIACFTPTAKPWHRLCPRCWAWHLAGQHLRRYVDLTHQIRTTSR